MTFRVNWSEEAENRLRVVWKDPSLSATAVGAALGVSFGAAKNKARRMGLGARARATYAGRPWLAEDDAVLRAVFAAGGNSRTASAAMPGRTVDACQNRARKLRVTSSVVPPALPALKAEAARDVAALRIIHAPAPVRQPMAPVLAAKSCQYPLWGNSERATGRLCEGPLFRGSYCVDHFGACYISRHATEKVF